MIGLNSIPPVTKNILILNILMFILTFYFESQGVNLNSMLGAHYFNSPLFEPYQMVSYFFMHGGLFHILFNMFALVMFGGFLEQLWGPKRFFILYVSSAIGALVMYNGIGVLEIMELKSKLSAAGIDVAAINQTLISSGGREGMTVFDPTLNTILQEYQIKCIIPMIGASGSVFGIMAAFAILFPNTELQLIFPPIPIKAKYLIGGYFVFEVYSSIYESKGDNVAHLAHVGGAIVGVLLVLIWKKRRTDFY